MYNNVLRLRNNNHRLLALIQHFGGRIVTERFRDECNEFRYHVHQWDDVWKDVEPRFWATSKIVDDAAEGELIPFDPTLGGIAEGEVLYANRFRESIWQALENEMNEVSRSAHPK